MKDILVLETPYRIKNRNQNEKDIWGYKWIGFCNGKRFVVTLNPYDTIIDEVNGIYSFTTNEEENVLPERIRKVMYSHPLSNQYFILHANGKETSIEVVMQLIEKGYDITKVTKDIYFGHKSEEKPYLCKYINEETGKLIVTIVTEGKVIWAGDDSVNKIYLDLLKKLTTLYKKNSLVGISIKTIDNNKKFDFSCFLKIDDIEIEDEYICIELNDYGGELYIYEKMEICYEERNNCVNKEMFVINMGNVVAQIDCKGDF